MAKITKRIAKKSKLLKLPFIKIAQKKPGKIYLAKNPFH